MHIILGLLGILGAIGAIAWRINMARHGAEVLKDAADTAINLPRKMRFKAKANRQRLSAVEDPREAVAILLLGIARAGGEVSSDQKAAMRAQMEAEFSCNAATSEELLARAAWYSANVADPADLVPRMTDFIAQRVEHEQLTSVEIMLNAIGTVEGEMAHDQIVYLRRYRERAGLR